MNESLDRPCHYCPISFVSDLPVQNACFWYEWYEPILFMSVLPSKECDRNPGVHEDRVDQPVKINLRRNFDLQKNDEWDDGLNESDDGPELLRHEHIVVEDDCEAGIEHIDICHHQVERGEDEEIVLQKLHDAI